MPEERFIVSARARAETLASGAPIAPGQEVTADAEANQHLIDGGVLSPLVSPSPKPRRSRAKAKTKTKTPATPSAAGGTR